MDFAFSPPTRPCVPIAGQNSSFPVRRVFCVGQNYAAHAREMGHDPNRAPPFFFMKPADALADPTQPVPYPPATADLHHEVELVAAIGQGGADISTKAALDHVWGLAIGLDLTRRDLQSAAKAKGRPWDMAKGFDNSAVIGPIHHKTVSEPLRGSIKCTVNGDLRQDGDLSEMIWSLPEVIASLSTYVTLAQGDLIMTGTPSGVGPLQRGDVCMAEIAGLGALSFSMAR